MCNRNRTFLGFIFLFWAQFVLSGWHRIGFYGDVRFFIQQWFQRECRPTRRKTIQIHNTQTGGFPEIGMSTGSCVRLWALKRGVSKTEPTCSFGDTACRENSKEQVKLMWRSAYIPPGSCNASSSPSSTSSVVARHLPFSLSHKSRGVSRRRLPSKLPWENPLCVKKLPFCLLLSGTVLRDNIVHYEVRGIIHGTL